MRFCSPSHDDEEIQPVPGVSQVTAAAEDAESHHLHHHLQRKEDVDKSIKGLKEGQHKKVMGFLYNGRQGLGKEMICCGLGLSSSSW